MQLVAPPLVEGDELGEGRYRVDAVRGRGRQGITYLATDQRRRRPVMVVELLPVGAARQGDEVEPSGGPAVADDQAPDRAGDDLAAGRRRFLAGARALARVVHPNVVTILAVLEERGTAYAVTEAVAGTSLAAVVAARGALPEAEALDIAQQAADALAAVRLVGLPSPLVTAADLVLTSTGRVVLVDPGLASAAGRSGAPPSLRADVRALGALLHHMLSGRPTGTTEEHRPGEGRSEPTAPDRAAAGPAGPEGPAPVALWRVNPTVSRATSDAVADALGPDPARRPASPAVLLGRLGVGVEALGAPDLVDLRPDPLAPFLGPGQLGLPLAASPGPDRSGVPLAPSPGPGGGRMAASARALVTVDLPPWRPPLVPAAATVALVAPVVSPSGRTWPVPVPVGPTTTPRLPRLGVHPARQGLTAEQRLELARTVPAGRRWVTVPLGGAAMALASARPATLVVLLGLALAPLVATVGDRAVRPEHARVWLPLWWARNLVISTVRTIGPALVVFLGTCLWYGSTAFSALAPTGPWVLRVVGVVAGGLLGLSISRGGEGFRSHLGLDVVTRRLLPRGRLSSAGVALLLVCVGLAAIGLAVAPEAWPLR